MKNLLFITTELPFPADSGGRIKTFRLVKFLSQHYEVRLVCAHGKNDRQSLMDFRAATGVAGVQVFNTRRKRTAFNWLRALMSFPTFNTFRVYSKEMEAMLRWGVAQSEIVVVDHLEMMEMLPERLVPKVVYHSHNAEFKLWQEMTAIEPNPLKKAVLAWEADRVKTFENWVVRTSKITFAAPNDSTQLAAACGLDKAKFRNTYHLGNDALLTLPDIDLGANASKVFYAGTLHWQPNHDGLLWFIRHCWNQVKAQVPEATLVVCGRGADAHLLTAMRHAGGITYRGFVDDLAREMAECRCAVVPLRFGSGMKVKTIDALYRGLPLATTSVGAEGIALEDGVHALVENDATALAKAVVSLLTDTAKATTMRNAARQLAQSEYTYDKLFAQMGRDLAYAATNA